MASDNNMHAHEETYGGFLGLLKWATAATLVAVIVVIALIA